MFLDLSMVFNIELKLVSDKSLSLELARVGAMAFCTITISDRFYLSFTPFIVSVVVSMAIVVVAVFSHFNKK